MAIGDIIINLFHSIEDLTPVSGKTGIKILPDCVISDIKKDELFDLVSMPG